MRVDTLKWKLERAGDVAEVEYLWDHLCCSGCAWTEIHDRDDPPGRVAFSHRQSVEAIVSPRERYNDGEPHPNGEVVSPLYIYHDGINGLDDPFIRAIVDEGLFVEWNGSPALAIIVAPRLHMLPSLDHFHGAEIVYHGEPITLEQAIARESEKEYGDA